MLNVIWKSKTFWMTVLDVVFGALALLGPALWPAYSDLVLNVWKLLQPVFAVLIALFCTEEIIVPKVVSAIRKLL
jgi:hypothetical protein